MAIAGIDPKCYILALFVRDDGVRFLLGDDPYEFKDKQLHFQPNTVANDVVEVQGNDGYLLAGQVRRAGTQSFDGYVCNGTNSKAEVEVKRREFLQFFRRSHFYKVIYVFPNGTAIQRKQGFLVDDPTVQELYQQYPEYHVALNFEDVNYYTYEEDDQGQEIYAKEAIVPLAGGGATGGLIWDEYGVVWEDPWSDLVSVSGSEIQIDNNAGARAPIQELELQGDTYQQTYSGKNLWDMSPENRVSGKGWSTNLSTDGDGWITGTGVNDFYNFWTKPSSILLTNTTYYYVLEIKEVYAANNSDRLVLVDSASDTQCNTIIELQYKNLQAGGVYTGSFVTKSDFSGAKMMLRSFLRPYNASSKIVFRLSIVAAQPSASSFVYEPFVGGTASPSPSYPQAVQTVTGEQTIDLIGKNLLDVSSLSQTAINVGQVVENGLLSDTFPTSDSRYWGYASCNWTITLSPGIYTLSESFTKRCTNASIGALRIYTSSGTVLVNNYTISDKDHVADTFTLTETTTIGIMIKIADGECYVQLEKGANATAYEPYHNQSYTISLGSIELCKIGDYQDYIYKGTDGWYVHKECEKDVIDGDTEWTKSAYGTNNYSYVTKTPAVIVRSSTPELVASILVKSDCFEGVSFNDRTINQPNITYITAIGSDSAIFVRNSNFNTASELSTFCANNNPMFYYPVSTPTDTQITDATLIGQLEALGAMRLFIGENNLLVSATGTNLPATLEFSYPTKFAAIGAEWEEGGTKGATIVDVNAIDNTYPVWELMGPAVNPTISVLTTNTTLTYNGTITASQKLVIDMFNKTATLNGTSVIGNVSGDFVYMAPGTNRIAYTAGNTDAPDSTIYWQEVVG